MGRKLKHITDEEKISARKKRQMRYYWKNVEKMRKQALGRYYAKKIND
jgi:hypothetical protein